MTYREPGDRVHRGPVRYLMTGTRRRPVLLELCPFGHLVQAHHADIWAGSALESLASRRPYRIVDCRGTLPEGVTP